LKERLHAELEPTLKPELRKALEVEYAGKKALENIGNMVESQYKTKFDRELEKPEVRERLERDIDQDPEIKELKKAEQEARKKAEKAKPELEKAVIAARKELVLVVEKALGSGIDAGGFPCTAALTSANELHRFGEGHPKILEISENKIKHPKKGVLVAGKTWCCNKCGNTFIMKTKPAKCERCMMSDFREVA